MRRLSVVLPVVVLAVFPAIASSAAPIMERTVSGAFTVSAESCGFPVVVRPSQDRLRIFTFSDGRQVITASYIATATANGKTLNLNLSGQARFELHADGSATFTTSGTTLFFLPGSLELIHGPVVFEFDPEGNADIRVVSSSVTDVCAILADP